jgi:L-threonylcarbamoyladenylate synthase
LNLRPPRPERGALPDCATLRLKARLITRVGKGPQARSRSKDMTAQPATPVLKIEPQAIVPDAAAAVERAARTLAAGGLVAFPTETVYGLGADATNGAAVARLYEAKDRPSFNPLIAHVADAAAARALARFDSAAQRLAAAFWPGPLTLVLPKRADCPVAELATAGLDTIAVRVPSHPIARAILIAFGRPVVAPSANRSGHVSPTTAQHVLADLRGRIELILDGGPTPMGLESTIVACLDRAVLLRPGALPRADIERLVKLAQGPVAPPAHVDELPIAPGALASHYAPRAPLRLNARHVEAHEALLAFGPTAVEGATRAVAVLNLSPGGDLIEAAANLFSHLRALDVSGAAAIAVMPVPRAGLGEAINDRLERAAAPRA